VDPDPGGPKTCGSGTLAVGALWDSLCSNNSAVSGTYADSDGGEAAEGDEEGEEYGEPVGPDLGEHRHRVHLHRDLSLQYISQQVVPIVLEKTAFLL
jgi:hypothetical protein